MRIICVDDEEITVEYMERLIAQVEPQAEVIGFAEPEEAFDYLSKNIVDIAILDIEMGEYSGMGLAKKCKDLCPTVNIIFATGYSQYMQEAFALHASGYLMKPIRADDLRTELANLRHPLPQLNKRVRVQTFGNFEVFVDGKPLKVPRKKCKECLAYLVDRKGAGVPYAQLSSLLWEDVPYDRTAQKKTQTVISALGKALGAVKVADILIRTRMEIAIDVAKVDCDYFRAVCGDMAWMNAFTGEYMSNYSWAEATLGELVDIKKRNG